MFDTIKSKLIGLLSLFIGALLLTIGYGFID